MTVAVQTTFNTYTGNGVTTVFPYQFKILDQADLTVYVGGALKTLTADYTVSGVGVDAGGSVTMLVAPAAAAAVSVIRAMQVKRTTDYQTAGDFAALTVNPDFDRAILLIQDAQTQLGRSLRLPADEVGTLPTLPSKTARAGKYDAWDALGNPIASVGTGNDTALRTDLATTTSGADGSRLVGFRRTEAGSVALSVFAVLNNFLVPSMFGAVGDGATNDSTALQALIDGATAGSVVDGLGKTYAVRQVNVTKRLVFRNLNLTMLNAASLTTQQACFNITANDVVLENCGATVPSSGLGNVTNASGLYALSVSGLRVYAGKWSGSKQDAASYSANVFGSVIHMQLCSDAIVDSCAVDGANAEGVYQWTCTKSKILNCTITNSGYGGIAVDLGGDNKCCNNFIDTTTASGLGFSSPRGLVSGNTVVNTQTSGITLGHVPGYPVDDTICEANTVSNYGISTTNPTGFGGINVQGGNRVKVRNNNIKASFNNTASSKFNHGIQCGSTPVSVEIVGNTIDTAYGYGIRSTDSTDVQFAMICDNTITNSWFDGIVVVGCSRAMLKGNRIFQPNRANDANSYGMSVTRSGVADPLTLEFDGNTILDTSNQMRYGIMVNSLGGTTVIQNVRNNTIRGALTAPLNTAGGWRYNQSGNDFAGGARSGSVTLAGAATSTTVNTGECNTKTAPIVIPGNAQAAALSIWVGSPSAGSFTIGSAAAAGTELVQWIIP